MTHIRRILKYFTVFVVSVLLFRPRDFLTGHWFVNSENTFDLV